MRQRVVLIETTSRRYREDPLSQMDRVLEPLAIESIAGHLLALGHDVDLLQQLQMSPEEVVSRVVDLAPEVVGFSCMTYSYPETEELARRIKAELDVQTVLGGYHTLGMDAANPPPPCFDFVVRGEGELAMEKILAYLAPTPRAALSEIPGLAFHRSDWVESPLRRLGANEFPKTVRLPREPYFSYSMGENLPETRMACVVAGRGCPYRCDFCCTPQLFQGRRVLRPVSEVVDEILELRDGLGVNHVNLRDETFTPDREYVRAFCRALIECRAGVSWRAFAYVGNCDAEMLGLMAEAGCAVLFYGVEASDLETLRARRKRFPSQERVFEDVANAQAVGIYVRAGFIVGHETDTEESFERHLRFLKALCPDELYVSFLTPFPGTPLYAEARRQGSLLTQDYAQYDCEHPILKIGLSAEDLLRLRRELYRGFYGSAEWRRHAARRAAAGERELRHVTRFAGHMAEKFSLGTIELPSNVRAC